MTYKCVWWDVKHFSTQLNPSNLESLTSCNYMYVHGPD